MKASKVGLILWTRNYNNFFHRQQYYGRKGILERQARWGIYLSNYES